MAGNLTKIRPAATTSPISKPKTAATFGGFSILEMELYGDPDATCRD